MVKTCIGRPKSKLKKKTKPKKVCDPPLEVVDRVCEEPEPVPPEEEERVEEEEAIVDEIGHGVSRNGEEE
ncbi:unnamed protein product [Arabis nemorensis]|uniref:Uncharacterized protein n=1 Tax=Arabis nemorensis TaxID=586526 RepID=A0A565AWM7_9BRAS|nr:unnamed protein product [Arabis nemorensis]